MKLEDHILVGAYSSKEKVIDIITELKESGYRSDDISVIGKDTNEAELILDQNEEKISDSVAGGAISGGLLGGIGGWLAGVTVLTVTGIGPLIVAGPIAMTLSGVVFGAGAGGLIGSLVGLGLTEDEAKDYEERVKKGDYLIIVKDDNDNNLRKIMSEKPYRQPVE